MIKRYVFQLLLFFLVFFIANYAQSQRFSEDVQSMLLNEKSSDTANCPILFVGSSSFTKWHDVNDYFPETHILNRGFGGSTLLDQMEYATKLIFSCHPRQIVIYCGENDLAENERLSGAAVYKRFKHFYRMIKKQFPDMPVAFISLKPSQSRWNLQAKMQKANRKIKRFLQCHHRGEFIDVYSLMLGEDGKPIPQIFIEDNLHMNKQGYMIWKKAIDPVLIPMNK